MSSHLFKKYALFHLYSLVHSLFAQTYKAPTVAISVLVRNKAHTLPYFLTCIHRLDYPKERIYIRFDTENNDDNTLTILRAWTAKYGPQYNNIYFNANTSTSKPISSTQWNEDKFWHIIRLRQSSLNFARDNWADYIFMIDADVFLTHKQTLKDLISKNATLVAPMLESDGLYSNFWCGMDDRYYYKRTDDYLPILNRERLGCFKVPMVHTAVLMNLREMSSEFLTYNSRILAGYDGPIDDVITLAMSAKIYDINMKVCNDEAYGYVTVPFDEQSKASLEQHESEQILNVKLEAIAYGASLPLDEFMEQFVHYPKPSTLGFDKIFMINLERRKERRELMMSAFKELGMDVTVLKAVDGRELNPEELTRRSIKLMRSYEDPYHGRPMKMGEIGCFLSHFNVWKEIVDKNLEVSLVLEDDLHFTPYFRAKMSRVLNELNELDWDLMYVGRKILQEEKEHLVSEHIVRPRYSYWTLGYALTLRGAAKLLAAKPLDNLLPVDEFLPIMFGQHPNLTWSQHFEPRNLVAYSASPLLVTPTHYTGEPGYISDTELSDVASPVAADVHSDL